MKLGLFFIIAMSVFSTNIAAADAVAVVMVAHLEECLKSDEGQSTAGMQMCHGQTTEIAEQMMDFYYNITIKQFDRDSTSSDQDIKSFAVDAKSRLVTSQDLWIQFREANCSMAGVAMLGGSGEGTMIAACYSKMTIDRLNELMELF